MLAVTDLYSNWGPMNFKQKILLQVCNETAVEQKFVGVDGRLHLEVNRGLCVGLNKAAGEDDGGLPESGLLPVSISKCYVNTFTDACNNFGDENENVHPSFSENLC